MDVAGIGETIYKEHGKEMKILYIITKSEIGGAQTHVAQLMKAMKEKGHDVALMAYPGGWLEGKAKEYGLHFYSNTYFTNTYNPVRALRAIKEIKKAIRSFSPTIVTCHSSGAGFFGRVAIRNKIPTIYTAHGWAFTPGAPLFRRALAYAAEKLVVGYATKIICVSEFDRKLALEYRLASKRKLTTVYNGVEIPNTTATVDDDNPTLLFIGRLTYQKDSSLLVKSYKALPRHIQESCTLKIIGGGPEKGMLKNTIENLQLSGKVIMDEVVPERIPDILLSSDIFILLSRYEGFPMTILEAMSYGLPVISSIVGGTPEQIDGSCGILVHNKIDEVTHAITELVIDKEKRKKMGQAAREKVYTKFGIQRFVDETENVYRDAATISKRF